MIPPFVETTNSLTPPEHASRDVDGHFASRRKAHGSLSGAAGKIEQRIVGRYGQFSNHGLLEPANLFLSALLVIFIVSILLGVEPRSE